MVAAPRILIDTREKDPWIFSEPTRKACLPVGDYAVEGRRRYVERKSWSNFLSDVQRRRPWIRQLDKMCRRKISNEWLSIIVVEDPLWAPEFLTPAAEGLQLAVSFGVPVVFIPRVYAPTFAVAWLTGADLDVRESL